MSSHSNSFTAYRAVIVNDKSSPNDNIIKGVQRLVNTQIDLLSIPEPDMLPGVVPLEPTPAGTAPAPAPVTPVKARVATTSPSPSPSPVFILKKMDVNAPVFTPQKDEDVKRVAVRITNQAGEDVNLAELAAVSAKAAPANAIRLANPQPVGRYRRVASVPAAGPMGHPSFETPHRVLAYLETNMKDSTVAECGAFIKKELLTHQKNWGVEGCKGAPTWLLRKTLKAFIVALHKKFPPSGGALCADEITAWVRDMYVSVDNVQRVAEQHARADSLLAEMLKGINKQKN